jgi:OFA family oxalate/formate antiporter-like MFS transporter
MRSGQVPLRVRNGFDALTEGAAWRWVQLVLGIVCMVAIANLQYGWTLFIGPIDQKYGWGLPALQLTFTIAVATETFLAVPFGGRLVDRFGPSIVWVSGLLIAFAWYINSFADSLLLFYGAAVIAGLGTGLVFAAAYGNALKWFPDRRGLAAGLTAAGFAGGGVVTVVALSNMIKSSGYEAAYLWFGLGQGLVVVASALLLRAPRHHATDIAARSAQMAPAAHQYAVGEVLRSRPFWLMYAMFVMVGAGGLMLQAQLAPIAADLGIDKVPVSILGITMLTPVFAVSFNQVTNGLSRPAFGWVSDWFGRERTMFVAFLLESLAFLAVIFLADAPIRFVLVSGLVFFAWGEIFSLFPAICTDIYGSKFASRNYGMLYTAKGVASLLVPLASVLKDTTGSWTAVFAAAAAFNFVAALVALLLRSTLARQREKSVPA